jgi:hypothetical protein
MALAPQPHQSPFPTLRPHGRDARAPLSTPLPSTPTANECHPHHSNFPPRDNRRRGHRRPACERHSPRNLTSPLSPPCAHTGGTPMPLSQPLFPPRRLQMNATLITATSLHATIEEGGTGVPPVKGTRPATSPVPFPHPAPTRAGRPCPSLYPSSLHADCK